MAGLHEFRSKLLVDHKITPNEVGVIREYVHRDGKLDLEDIKFLIDLLSEAREVCFEFDAFFFPVLKEAILADGRIESDEQFYILKLLYSDGVIRDSEREFLEELRRDADVVTPEFEQLCETALAAPARNWDLGG